MSCHKRHRLANTIWKGENRVLTLPNFKSTYFRAIVAKVMRDWDTADTEIRGTEKEPKNGFTVNVADVLQRSKGNAIEQGWPSHQTVPKH